MPADLVVDTNVFMHAGNPNVKFFGGALRFVQALENSTVPICIDKPRANSVPDENASLILAEYRRRMKPTTYGMAVLAKLASTQRIQWVSRDVGAAINKRIRMLIPKNTRDKTFVRVSYNNVAHLLVSDDSEDFAVTVRRNVRRDLGIRVEYSMVDFHAL